MAIEGDDSVTVLGQDDVDLAIGETVGEYQVQAKIGEGGFGTVFRAIHPVIGKQVAIKVLARQYSAQPEMVSRFVAEARAVNQIRHRHIIDIFSFGQLEDGRHYYVMELLDGQPMDQYLRQRGRLELSEAVPLLRALARALDAAHGKGIAHRDLKPENVFLVQEDGDVYPKLLDFGIAKLLGDTTPQKFKTRTGAPMGTPAYMSPEQCRGRDVDHRTDIYAFGILTYQVLVGDVPFNGEDYMEILLKQIGEEPPAPSSKCPGLPASVDQGVLWMLAKDPSSRPPNLVTAVRALEDAALAAGFDVPAGPGPTGAYATPTGKPMSPHPTPASLARTEPGDRFSDRPTEALGTAETVDAERLSAELAAVPRGKSRAPLVAGALAVAVAAGVTAYFGFRKSTPSDEPTVPAASQRAAVPVAQADAAPVVPPADAAPALPRVVNIDISGPPQGTEVYGPSGLLGVAPGRVQLPRGEAEIVLTLKADGYQVKTATVEPSADRELEVELVRKPRGGRGGKDGKDGKTGRDGTDGKDGKDGVNRRDTIEDPFK